MSESLLILFNYYVCRLVWVYSWRRLGPTRSCCTRPPMTATEECTCCALMGLMQAKALLFCPMETTQPCCCKENSADNCSRH